ncbi:MFS transporter [Frondihabitans sucicola]|uniref:MFS transporter n=1 Tax=Frondihabitans sucicola TaxID=1268041 RepID=A0ABM8GLN6_9MICO|nr:MFS transporter [Frondihabitans sucicola]BDZ49110.1 MFS transporter [Frondihabitans sucicola]
MTAETDTRQNLGFAAVLFVFAVVMIGTTLPTPIYPQYQAAFGFSGSTTTVLFAVYAAGVIAALIGVGQLSQIIGRKPMLLAGILLSFVSAILFSIGTAEGLLFAGRIFSGFSAGILTSTGTVAVLEQAPAARKAVAGALATAANIGGLGLGMFLAGLVSQLTPWPTRAPFVMHALLLVLAGLALLLVRETVKKQQDARFRLQRPGIPREARSVFGAASIGAVAGFAVCGLYSSVAPNFVGTVLGIHSALVVGVVTASLFAASAVAQIVLGKLAVVRAIVLGSILLFVGMILLAVALPLASLALLIVSSVVSGAGQGLLFSYGLRAIVGATPDDRRTEATSAYFVVAYLAISVPAILAGFAERLFGLAPTGIGFAAVMAVLCVIGFATRKRFAGAAD